MTTTSRHPITDEEAAYWSEIRKQFYLMDDVTYLQGGTVGPSARPVIERIIDLMREFERIRSTAGTETCSGPWWRHPGRSWPGSWGRPRTGSPSC